MLEISGLEGIEKFRQVIKNFILWARWDVQLCEPPPPPSQAKSLPNPPSSPAQSLSTPPSLSSSPILPPLDPPLSPALLSLPPEPFNYPASLPYKDPKQMTPPPEQRKKKFYVPKLDSPFEQEKECWHNQIFIRNCTERTRHTIDLAEHEKSAQKSTTIIVNIRKPTWEDYQNMPNTYALGRPLLTWDKLKKVLAGIKRLHD